MGYGVRRGVEDRDTDSDNGGESTRTDLDEALDHELEARP